MYLRVSEIKPFEIDLSDTKFIHSSEVSKDVQVKEGDLLVTRKGSFGFAVVASKKVENSIISSEVFKINLKDRKNAKFIEIWFNTNSGQQVFDRVKTGGIMGHITQVVLKNLFIPLPDKKTQSEIITFFETAYDSKKQKEAEAAELLASIDNYLLEQLGITLPPQTEKKTSFITNFNKLSGGRFDPFYHQNYFQQAEKAISSAIYSCIKFRDVIKQLKTGTTPHQNLNPFDNQGIMFLRNTNLKPYEFDLSEIRFIKQEYKNLLTFSYRDEVIICIAGTVGTSAVNKLNEPIAINQNITSIKINKDLIDSNFLVAYLNSKLAIELTKRICSVATIFYLNNENLKNLQIPLPPLEKQEAIAAHINEIRAKAKHLQHQAAETLEQAKQHVEKMILG